MRLLRRAAALGCLIVVVTVSPAAGDSTTTSAPPTSAPSTSAPPTSATTTSSTTTPPKTTARVVRRPRATVADPVVHILANATCQFCFSPETVTVAVGTSVTWSNTDEVQHTVARCVPARCNGVSGGTGTDTNFGAAEIALPVGKSFHYAFSAPGTYVYYCTIHGYALMHGTIIVTAVEPTTTTAAPATTPATPLAPPPTVSVGPRLAGTGSRTGGTLAIAIAMIGLGLTATTLQPGRRYAATNRRGELPSDT